MAKVHVWLGPHARGVFTTREAADAARQGVGEVVECDLDPTIKAGPLGIEDPRRVYVWDHCRRSKIVFASLLAALDHPAYRDHPGRGCGSIDEFVLDVPVGARSLPPDFRRRGWDSFSAEWGEDDVDAPYPPGRPWNWRDMTQAEIWGRTGGGKPERGPFNR